MTKLISDMKFSLQIYQMNGPGLLTTNTGWAQKIENLGKIGGHQTREQGHLLGLDLEFVS